jgi:hypothetical protein
VDAFRRLGQSDHGPANPPGYETEAAFLRRHGLLTAAEQRASAKEDYEPEIIGHD